MKSIQMIILFVFAAVLVFAYKIPNLLSDEAFIDSVADYSAIAALIADRDTDQIGENESANEHLIFSVDLVRHGDRTPIIEIPNSPHDWKHPLASLTEKGAKQETHLGRQLRREYMEKSSLLPAEYHPDLIYVRSTDTSRTIASANALLEGLYPIETRGKDGTQIPITIVKKEDDDLLLVRPSANLIDFVEFYFHKQTLWKEKTGSIKDKLEHWRKVTGLDLKNLDQIDQLADNLRIRKIHHIPHPDGIDDQSAKEIESIAESSMVSYFKFPALSGPTGRKLISAILDHINQSIDGKSKLKYVLFFAHDSTIMSVLATLGVDFREVPGYASRLNFSVFKKNENYRLRVNLNGKSLRIPRCASSSCPRSDWNSIEVF